MTKREIIYVFIDSQNLNQNIKALGWKLDFQKFYIYLKDKYKATEVFLFIGYIARFQSLYFKLKNIGYNLIFKQTIINKKGDTKGNIDAELVLHSAKIQYQYYSQAIVVSGDGDFLCLYNELNKDNKLLRILVPSRRSESSLLYKYKNKKAYIEDLRQKVEKKWGFGY